MGLSPFLAVLFSWREAKLFLKHSIAFSTDSVHVIAGVAIMLAAALLLKRPLSSWRPWLVALTFTFLNEFIDLYINRWPQRAVQYGEGAKDILLTMVLPTMLMLASRRYPRIFQARVESARTDGADTG